MPLTLVACRASLQHALSVSVLLAAVLTCMFCSVLREARSLQRCRSRVQEPLALLHCPPEAWRKSQHCLQQRVMVSCWLDNPSWVPAHTAVSVGGTANTSVSV